MYLDLLIIWNIIVDRNVFIALTIQLILNKEEYDFNWVKVEVFYKKWPIHGLFFVYICPLNKYYNAYIKYIKKSPYNIWCWDSNSQPLEPLEHKSPPTTRPLPPWQWYSLPLFKYPITEES